MKVKAQLHLTARRPAERLLRAWGGNDRATLQHTKEAIVSCLQVSMMLALLCPVLPCPALPFFHCHPLLALPRSLTWFLQEYLSSKDVSEARHCLRKLAVPFFHHEVVKQALLCCMEEEEHSSNEESLVQLLKQLSSTGDISNSQMARVISDCYAVCISSCW